MPYSTTDFSRDVEIALRRARYQPATETAIKADLSAISTALNSPVEPATGRTEAQPGAALDQTDLTFAQHYRDICAAVNCGKDGDLSNADMKGVIDAALAAYSYPPELIWDPIATWPSGTTEATTTDGTWRWEPVITYQWMTSGDPAVAIDMATSASYQIQESDAGTDIFCAVTGTNDDGAVTANTNAIRVPTLPE